MLRIWTSRQVQDPVSPPSGCVQESIVHGPSISWPIGFWDASVLPGNAGSCRRPRRSMSAFLLCRERLNRLLRILEDGHDGISVRDLQRTYRFEWWELEQAEELGWVRTSVRMPRTGRPSTQLWRISNCQHAKLPPLRNDTPRWIKWKHRCFAEWTQAVVPASSAGGFRMITKVEAYMRVYPGCRSRNAAAVSASRLMRRTDVRLMIRWLRCQSNGEVRGVMPFTERELIDQLEPLGVIRFVLRSRP